MIHHVVHHGEAKLPCSPPAMAPHRQREWQSSRWALYLGLKELCPQLDLRTSGDFEITRHHCLKKAPHILVGLSHTGDYGAAVVALNSKARGVGIDIEEQDRPVSPKSLRYYRTSRDEPLAPLTLWTAKEAAYKALSPLEDLSFRDLWVSNSRFGRGGEQLGFLRFDCHRHLAVAVAWIDMFD